MNKPMGLLFIGDPHVTAVKPSRRLEADFLSVSLGKLTRALAIAQERNLVPIITGDLVNKPYERAVIHDLITALIDVRPFCLPGNHVGNGTDTTAGILMASRAIRAFSGDSPADIELESGTVRLHGADHGEPIPSSLPQASGVLNVLVTHHNLEFKRGKKYPGMVVPPQVDGCSLAVNGHVHTIGESVLSGDTHWHNPGNLLRMSVDLKDHAPHVLMVTVKDGKFVSEMLPLPGVVPHVFEADLGRDLLDSLPAIPSSSDFAVALASAAGLDRPQSESGDDLGESMNKMLDEDGVSEPVKRILTDLFNEVIQTCDP